MDLEVVTRAGEEPRLDRQMELERELDRMLVALSQHRREVRARPGVGGPHLFEVVAALVGEARRRRGLTAARGVLADELLDRHARGVADELECLVQSPLERGPVIEIVELVEPLDTGVLVEQMVPESFDLDHRIAPRVGGIAA
jgi:hypothetical protein